MKILISTILLFALMGCGSSGTSSGTETGHFTGQIISGLKYKTNTHSGITDENGEFSYKEGEAISFYVGEILLATVKASEELTLFDLAETKAPMNELDYKQSVADKSMSKLLNLASFLQTIDEDTDSSNGIVIPKEFDTISKDIELDFTDDYYSIRNAFNLRKLMYLGRSNDIWEESRTIVKPRVALDTLYKVMNLVPNVYAISSKQYKYIYNESNISTYVPNEYGNAILNKIDENSTFSYNDFGQKISSLIDKNNNGIIDFKNVYSYDRYGNLIVKNEYINDTVLIQFDNNQNVFYDYSEDNGRLIIYKKIEQSYNLDGNLKKYQKLDVHYNLFFDTNRTYSYDKYGNNIFQKVELNKYDSYCYIYKYNALGKRTLDEFDDDCDGQIERRTTFSYDEENRYLSRLEDYDANGIIDRNETNFYEDNGGKSVLNLAYDDNTNIDFRFFRTFNEDEKLVAYEYDFEADGILESNVTYEYSKTGKILFEKSYNPDGVLMYLSSDKYDTHDNLLLSETKDMVENKVMYQSIYSYDEKDNLLTSSIKGDGSHDYDEVYTYDKYGNKLSYFKILKQGENITKVETTYTYINTSKWVSLDFYEKQ